MGKFIGLYFEPDAQKLEKNKHVVLIVDGYLRRMCFELVRRPKNICKACPLYWEKAGGKCMDDILNFPLELVYLSAVSDGKTAVI